jgi:hypothetical protein
VGGEIMTPVETSLAWSVGLFLGMLICLEIGYRLGSYGVEKHLDLAHEGTGTIEAAVFALLGLLLAFTFGGAMSRLEARRALIAQEANAIGTAYLRLDILPTAEQPGIRQLFRQYLDARLSAYQKLTQRDVSDQEFARAAAIQHQIWSRAVAAGQIDFTQNTVRVLLPALNDMDDVTTSRAIALDTHLPALIFLLLICVALLSALLAGHVMAKRKHRSALHMILYAAIISVTIYAVLDLDEPRSGLIRLDRADQALIELRDSIR